jgi:hypothetical protein
MPRCPRFDRMGIHNIDDRVWEPSLVLDFLKDTKMSALEVDSEADEWSRATEKIPKTTDQYPSPISSFPNPANFQSSKDQATASEE